MTLPPAVSSAIHNERPKLLADALDQASMAHFAVAAIRAALEAAGVEFIAENGGGAGVRLRKVLRL